MKAYVITIIGNELSEESAARCKRSADIEIETFNATTPDDVDAEFALHGIEWTYPLDKVKTDFKSGLTLSPYNTVDIKKRMACFMSHYNLWKTCLGTGPLLILEHDAIFIEKLKYKYLLDSKFGIISINDPRGATRLAHDYHEKVQISKDQVTPVPTLDEIKVPQGLPGNSAYIIKPSHAKKMIDLVSEFGAWPNDALMCKQLVPNIGVSKTYYTKVQGTKSTTSL